MAVSTGIFKTPTGPIYDPARDIERGFDKTTGIVTDFLQRKANDYDQQQALFGELSNKLGEIEANLQQNYAGMQQQAIDSTREWLKQSIKSGTRANDPEFQMALGQRVGAIRAAMGNADKIREQIDLQVKMIESNPYMDFIGKSNALTELFSMANNPDVLIDKNAVQKLSQVPNKYIDPFLVARESYNKNAPQGTVQNIFMDEQGNENIREISITDLTDAANPFDENGRVNFSKLTPERVNEILNRDSAFATVVEQIRQRDMPNQNQPEARAQIVKQLYSGVASTQQTTKIRRTADQIRKEQEAEKRAEIGFNLSVASTTAQLKKFKTDLDNANKAGRIQDQQKEDAIRFSEGYEKGDNAVLKPYEAFAKKAGINNLKWEKSMPLPDISSVESWNELDLEDKKMALELVGVNPENVVYYDNKNGEKIKRKPVDFTGEAVYKYFNDKRNQISPIIGISYINNDGKKIVRSMDDDLGGLSGAYNWLSSYRFSGTRPIPVSDPFYEGAQGEQPTTKKAPR